MIARQKSPNPCGPDTRPTYSAISRSRKQPPFGDHNMCTWSDDGHVYIFSCDNREQWRNITIWRLGIPSLGMSSHTPSQRVVPIPHANTSDMIKWGLFAEKGNDGATWKATGLISVNHKLYMALTRLVFPADPIKTFNLQIFKSDDHADSWTPQPPDQALEMVSPQFPDELNNSVSFFIYGQDNNTAVHGADKFVYGFSASGFPIPWIAGLYRVLGRCPIDKMDELHTGQYWQYYHGGEGGDGMKDSNWSDGSLASWRSASPIIDLRGRVPEDVAVLTPAPMQPVWFPKYKGGRYIYIANSGVNDPNNIVTPAPSGCEFWESPYPWGPWVQVGPTHLMTDRAKLVVTGEIGGYGIIPSFLQIIPSSIQDTHSSATAVVCFNGDWTTEGVQDPVYNEYQLHVATMQLSAGAEITVDPWPPGLAPAPLVITTSSLPQGIIGIPYSETLQAANGVHPYTWAHTTPLPAGLTLNSNGVISGTPTTASTTNVTFTVTDNVSTTASTQLPMFIKSDVEPISVVQTKMVMEAGNAQSITASFDAEVIASHTVVVIFTTFPVGMTTVFVQSVRDNLGRDLTQLFRENFTSGFAGVGFYTAGMAIALSVPSGLQSVTIIYTGEVFQPSIRMIEFAGTVNGIDEFEGLPQSTILTTWHSNYLPVVNNSLVIAFGMNSQFGQTAVAPPFQELPGGVHPYDLGAYWTTPPIASPGIRGEFSVVNSALPDRPGGISCMLVLHIAVVS